jgi:hypothetical protein
MDALQGCGMTDSFMQMTNGSSGSAGDEGHVQGQGQGQGVLIDFGQPHYPATSTDTMHSSSSADADANADYESQAAMFGHDLSHSQDDLHQGQGYQDHQGQGQASDDYHPGQPSTNPFATGEESHPLPAGIDLLIQSAPPPAQPFQSDHEQQQQGEESSVDGGNVPAYNPSSG